MKYVQVSPHVWPTLREIRADSRDAFDVYTYILTSRHRASEGIFLLPVAYIASDVGMDFETVTAALKVLEGAGHVRYDASAEVILDMHGLDRYAPKSKTQIAGALRKLAELPATPLKAELLKLAEDKAPDFANHIAEGMDTVPIPSAHPIETSTPALTPSPSQTQTPSPSRKNEDHGVSSRKSNGAKPTLPELTQCIRSAATNADADEALGAASFLLEHVDAVHLRNWIEDAGKLPDKPRHVSSVVEFVRTRAQRNHNHIPPYRVLKAVGGGEEW